MKLRVLIVMFASMLSALAAEIPVPVGMTEAKLLGLKGAPTSKATMGKKAIYRWPDMQITLIDGKVDQVQLRDSVAERRNSAERTASVNAKETAARIAADKAKHAAQKASAAKIRNRLEIVSADVHYGTYVVVTIANRADAPRTFRTSELVLKTSGVAYACREDLEPHPVPGNSQKNFTINFLDFKGTSAAIDVTWGPVVMQISGELR
jgi:hypothetical protein